MRKLSIQTILLSLGSLLTVNAAQSPTVDAPYAQDLVTSAMSAHPELQKLGIHVKAPTCQDDVIVACSVPSKIGKKSSPGDLDVERIGKPAVKTVTEQKFYDLALPLSDSQKRSIGMIVMEMRFSGAANADESVAKAQNIVREIESKIPNLKARLRKLPQNPLRSVATRSQCRDSRTFGNPPRLCAFNALFIVCALGACSESCCRSSYLATPEPARAKFYNQSRVGQPGQRHHVR